ncbi:MAG TPA: ethanolamine ammonia lyase-activating protein, partial [Chloroflexota bacterium]
MIDQKQAAPTEDLEELVKRDAYVEWQKREGVPVIQDFVFEDLNALELGLWPRKGGRGAIINIPNPYLPNDAHVVEIPKGSQTPPERHVYEEMVL